MKDYKTCLQCKYFQKIGGVYRSGYCHCEQGKWYYKRVAGIEIWQGNNSKACEYFK